MTGSRETKWSSSHFWVGGGGVGEWPGGDGRGGGISALLVACW